MKPHTDQSTQGCPSCGLPNYVGLCPHCRGDQDAYERELVPPFRSSKPTDCSDCDGVGEVLTEDGLHGTMLSCEGCEGSGSIALDDEQRP